MKQNTLSSYKKPRKRVGRGISAGQGKTSGRGHKGQKSRAGKKLRAGFEGGQTPLFKRLPKYRGFTNINYIEYQVVNVGQLDALKEKTIDQEILLKHRLISKKNMPVKVLGNGDLSSSLTISLAKVSQSALQKIESAGGKFTTTTKAKKTSHKTKYRDAMKKEEATSDLPSETEQSETKEGAEQSEAKEGDTKSHEATKL